MPVFREHREGIFQVTNECEDFALGMELDRRGQGGKPTTFIGGRVDSGSGGVDASNEDGFSTGDDFCTKRLS